MFKWLKKHFIPHEENDHRPYALHDESMRRVVAIVIALELIVFIIPSLANLGLSGGMAAVLPAVLGELTNDERQQEKLPTLSVNPLLTIAAQMKAEDMASKGYFAHTSPEGRTPWYWIELAGYKYQYAGENLAVNFRDSEDVTAAWLRSPTHKANIVKANYTEMGTGIARGLYNGKQSVFVAQVYANPMPAPVPKAQVVSSEPTENLAAGETEVLGSQTAVVSPGEKIAAQELDTEKKIVARPSIWQKLLASPRNTSNMIMATIFILVALALLIYIIVKRREHHRDLLGNGFAVLAIVGALVVANYYLSWSGMVVAESIDYTLEETL